jgi:hypothetical protein
MRFNNRFCALMDIPDLPAGAFEHIGDNKIKPQGGGNPVSAITDPISKAIGTDGSGGGALGALSKIDPGPALGKGLAKIDPGPALGRAGAAIDKSVTQPISRGLADLDKFVGREIPGGWATVGAAAAIAAAPYAASYLASSGAGAGAAGAGGSIGGISAGGAFVPTAGSAATFTVPGVAAAGTTAASAGIASEAGQAAFFDALATGATSSEAISAGLAAESLAAPAALMGPTYSELGITGLQQGLAGPTYAELGYSGLTEGLMGPTYGELGLTGLEIGTEASTGAPIFDYSQDVILSPGGNYIPANTLPSEVAGLDIQISEAGKEALAKYGGPTTSQKAIRGLNVARGLLGGQQQPQPRQQMQVGRAVTNPRGAVDYSGLLNLLSPRSAPRRNPNSLLG